MNSLKRRLLSICAYILLRSYESSKLDITIVSFLSLAFASIHLLKSTPTGLYASCICLFYYPSEMTKIQTANLVTLSSMSTAGILNNVEMQSRIAHFIIMHSAVTKINTVGVIKGSPIILIVHQNFL